MKVVLVVVKEGRKGLCKGISAQEVADQKTMNDNVKRNNEATASTSDTPEQFQAVETHSVSSMSLCSVATQSETGGINMKVEHLFENLKKAQAAIQHLESKLKHFRFDEDFFRFNDERVTYFTGFPNFSTLFTAFNCIKSEINGNFVFSPFKQMIWCTMRLRLPLPLTDLCIDLIYQKQMCPEYF